MSRIIKTFLMVLIGVCGTSGIQADETTSYSSYLSGTENGEAIVTAGLTEKVIGGFIGATAGVTGFRYYGKLVDQYGVPVEGVQIKARVMTGYLGGGGGLREVITNKKGEFAIKGSGSGVSFTQMLKPGYEIIPIRQYPELEDVQGPSRKYVDLENHNKRKKQKVFVAWKLEQQDLSTQFKHETPFYYFVSDSREYTVRLKGDSSPQKIPGPAEGDLRIKFYRDDTKDKWREKDWSYDIEVLTGAVVETNDVYKRRVPAEADYVNTIRFERKDIAVKNYLGWQGVRSFRRHYYLQFDDGTSGRLSMEFKPQYHDDDRVRGLQAGAIKFDYSLNLGGGRSVQDFKRFKRDYDY